MKEKVMSAAVVIFALAMAFKPVETVTSARAAMQICANSLVPALFPFFVCTFFLTQLGTLTAVSKKLSKLMKPLFGVSGTGAMPFLMGIVGGYPVGAKICAKLTQNGDLSKSEAEKLLAFCNNSGPLFVLGAVGGGMIGNGKMGLCLYVSHIMAAFTVAFVLRGIKCNINPAKSGVIPDSKVRKIKFGECLGNCISDAAESTVKICGYVILFKIIIGILSGFVKNKTVMLVLYSAFEVSGGCSMATEILHANPQVMCMAISAIISWSGLSVHMQVLTETSYAGLKLKKYFVGKLIMTVLSPVYTLAIMKILPLKTDVAVFASNLPQLYSFGIGTALVTVCVTVVITLVVSAFISRNKFSNTY